jgi:DNA-binding MarR family transcriptional regulator
MATRPTEAQAALGWRIFNWIGIIDQLAQTRATRALAELKLPMPQFIMLNHFSHRPGEAKTVTSVASALQQPQPGVTKTIQKMVARKLLKADPAPGDGRSKLITITPRGIEMHARAIAAFVPQFADVFSGWDDAEMETLARQLDRLKVWMDSRGRE